jgi:hypothetical protein
VLKLDRKIEVGVDPVRTVRLERAGEMPGPYDLEFLEDPYSKASNLSFAWGLS